MTNDELGSSSTYELTKQVAFARLIVKRALHLAAIILHWIIPAAVPLPLLSTVRDHMISLAALKAQEKKTKIDLLTHRPLATWRLHNRKNLPR